MVLVIIFFSYSMLTICYDMLALLSTICQLKRHAIEMRNAAPVEIHVLALVESRRSG